MSVVETHCRPNFLARQRGLAVSENDPVRHLYGIMRQVDV